MRRSESIVKLTAALLRAQRRIGTPERARTGTTGGREYQYADLFDVREAYRKPLSREGLVIMHTLGEAQHTRGAVLTTTLLHESGEWAASDFPIAVYDRPQEQGSAITYARRYNVQALLDIVAESDDDGAAASDAAEPASSSRSESRPPAELPEDALAINRLAAEVQQFTGEDLDKIIRRWSGFGAAGDRQEFGDPAQAAHRPRWLASTLKRARAEHSKQLKDRVVSEPGVAEAAAAFDAPAAEGERA